MALPGKLIREMSLGTKMTTECHHAKWTANFGLCELHDANALHVSCTILSGEHSYVVFRNIHNSGSHLILYGRINSLHEEG